MNPDVVVIGGGFAGLSAATALVESGARVTLFEARRALGGRATAFTDPVTHELVDNGQHVLLGCYQETLAFLRRIGTEHHLHRQHGLRASMVDREGVHSTLVLPPLPPPLHLAAGVLAWDALSWRDRASIFRVSIPLRRARADLETGRPIAPGSEKQTVKEWLTRHGQAPRLCELFWEPLAVAALNQPVDQASAASFIGVLARMLGPDADAASILVPSEPLNRLYAEPAGRWLESRGATVRADAPARIVIDHEGVVGVRVRGDVVRTTRVVAAVPWWSVAAAFDDPPACLEPVLTRAGRMASSPIVTVNLWFDRPIVQETMTGLPGRMFQWVFDKQAIFAGPSAHLSLVSSGAAGIVGRTNDELVAIAHRELSEAFPPARTAKLRRAVAVRERWATFSLAPGEPLRPSTGTPVPGLLLAGDWIDTGLPATIESAVVAGHRAAQAALRA